jgi:4-amino-4-deoxy-L-arabinose transferase-like glycosyltransferase
MEMGLIRPPAADTPAADPAPPNADAAQPLTRLWPLVVIVGLGALLRLALWWWSSGLLPQNDELDYTVLAANLAGHGEFALTPGVPTSLRPPLYPALVAGVYRLFGIDNFQAVRLFQAILSMVNVVLIYRLGRSLFSHRVGLWAAGLYCFYPSLLIYNNLLLTEVLFTFLLCGFCALVIRALQNDSLPALVGAAVVMGLATLTRSVLWLFPPVLAVFLLLTFRGTWRRRLVAVVAFVAAFAVTMAPWAVRNTRLQKTFIVVDVMGGRNLMMGNYEHTPLYRSWATIDQLPWEQSWFHDVITSCPPEVLETQGKIDKAAMGQGVKFIAAHPALTAQRTVVKFFDFWGLERELVAGGQRGYFGAIPGAVLLALTLAVCGAYVFVLFAGVFGAALAPPADRRLHLFLLLLVAFVCGLHALAFGHSRYHLPLIPLLTLYAASAVTQRRAIWERRRNWRFWLAGGACAVFVAGWVWMIVAVDGEHILKLLRSAA